MDRTLLRNLLIWFMKKLPLTDTVVFESFPDLGGNSISFYRYLGAQNRAGQHRMIWLLNKTDSIEKAEAMGVDYVVRYPRNLKEVLRKNYILCTAKYIIDSNEYVNPVRSDQVRIYLGHGMPIKIVRRYCDRITRADVMITTGKFFNNLYSQLFHTDMEHIYSLGFPRNDVLICNENREYQRKQFKCKKLVIWLPTYRQHINHEGDNETENTFPLGIPVIKDIVDLSELDVFLQKHNIQILLRLHPSQDQSILNVEETNNVLFADDNYLSRIGLSLYELLSISDALITDYSSVYYDYLLLDQPVALTPEDKEQYFESFEYPLEDYDLDIVGERVYTMEDLYAFLQRLCLQTTVEKNKEIKNAKEQYHDNYDGKSCERLYRLMKEQYGF